MEGQHSYADSIMVPVMNPNTIQILLTLMCMNPRYLTKIVDVERAFLQGKFENDKKLHVKIPDRMEGFYGSQKDVVL